MNFRSLNVSIRIRTVYIHDSRIAGPSSKFIPGNFSSKNEAKRFKSLSEGPALTSLQEQIALTCQKTLCM